MGVFSQTSFTSLSREKAPAIACLAAADRLTEDRKQPVAEPHRYTLGLPHRVAWSSPCALVATSIEPTVETDYRQLYKGGSDD